MTQSNLWKRGTAVTADVNVTDDDARDLGDVDVKSMPDTIDFDLVNDSNRELGNTQVTNTVDTTTTLPEPLDVSDATVTVTDDGALDIATLPEPLDVSDATITITDDGTLAINSLPNVDIATLPEPLDVSDATVTVTDDGALEISTLPEPLDVSGATVTVADDGAFSVNSLPEPLDVSGATVQTEEQRLNNKTSVSSFSHDVSNTMPSNSVPDGVDVMFQADNSNSSAVTVNGVQLDAGDAVTLGVKNTDAVTTGGTGTINVLYEDT